MGDILNYTAMQTLIERENWWFNAAEAHGILTGLVACCRSNAWRELLFPKGNITNTSRKTISTLTDHIDATLASTTLNYQLMLPKDASLSERAEALIYWVQGFKIAVLFLLENGSIKLDDVCSEFIADLDALSELDSQLADTEENNQLLTELEEHCRMGALMLYTYLHTPSTESHSL